MQNKTTIEKVNDKRYPILLGIILTATVVLAKKLWGKINHKAFFATIIIGAITAWCWQIWISYSNVLVQGWDYEPQKILGLRVGKITIEDVLFYPITGGTYYLLKCLIPKFRISEPLNYALNGAILLSVCLSAVLSCLIFNAGGVSITIAFMLMGILFYILSLERINAPHCIFMGIAVFASANIWSYFARDWYYPESFSWVKWGWIRGTPPEIFYWLNICGWIFIYSLSELMDKLFEKKSTN